MAQTKVIYIKDKEIYEKLNAEDNISELVVGLLREHYGNTSLNNLSLEELNKLLEIKQKEKELNKSKDEILQNGNN